VCGGPQHWRMGCASIVYFKKDGKTSKVHFLLSTKYKTYVLHCCRYTEKDITLL
jgi:hypothetical protein